MTKEELLKVPFRWSGHVSMAREHTTTYINTDYGFIMVARVSVLKSGRFGRERREFQYNGMWYKKFDRFLEAIKDVEFKEYDTMVVASRAEAGKEKTKTL